MCPSTFFGTLDCFSDNIIVAAAAPSAFTVPFVALKSASRSLLFSHFMGGLAHSGLKNLECQKVISFQIVNSSLALTIFQIISLLKNIQKVR